MRNEANPPALAFVLVLSAAVLVLVLETALDAGPWEKIEYRFAEHEYEREGRLHGVAFNPA